MAMQTVYLKEHEGNVHNPIGQFSSVPPAPWWSQLGSQPVYGATCGQLKSFSMEIPSEEAGQRLDKGNPTQFTLFPGDCKNSLDGQKLPGAISLQSAQPEKHACFEIGFGQHMICAKYPYADQYYGVFSAYGPQISGRIMLPLNLSSDDGPIYVNAKQYHGIIRRRKSRAKAVLENKISAKRKTYMHYSRHLHAMRRPRGCGGRFLNAKDRKEENGRIEEKKGGEQRLSPPTGSQSSEVLQSEDGNLNSSKETHCNTSNLSGSEVTSMYSRGISIASHLVISGKLSSLSLELWTVGVALLCPASGLLQQTAAATLELDSEEGAGLVLRAPNPLLAVTKWRSSMDFPDHHLV